MVHGTLRGGSHVTAEGHHFDGVQKAFFVVTLNTTDYLGVRNLFVLFLIRVQIKDPPHEYK